MMTPEITTNGNTVALNPKATAVTSPATNDLLVERGAAVRMANPRSSNRRAGTSGIAMRLSVTRST